MGALLIAMFTACSQGVPYTKRSVPTRATASVEIRSGLPVTLVTLGDVGDVELVLDLGSTHALTLTRNTLTRLSARPTGETHTFTDASGNSLTAAVYILPVLRWGGVEWRNVRVIDARWHPDYEPPLKVGVLGRRLFQGLRITLDFNNGRVQLAASTGCGPRAIPITERWGVVVPVTINGEQVQALIDTAATHNVTTEPRFAGVASLALGGEARPARFVEANLEGLPTSVLLGTPFLQANTITIDLGARCVESERTIAAVEVDSGNGTGH